MDQHRFSPFTLALVGGSSSLLILILGLFLPFPLLCVAYFAQLPLFLLCFVSSFEAVWVGGAVAGLLHATFVLGGQEQLFGYLLFCISPPMVLSCFMNREQKTGRPSHSFSWMQGPFETWIGQIFIGMGALVALAFHAFPGVTFQEKSSFQLDALFSLLSLETEVQQAALSWFQAYLGGAVAFSWMLMTWSNVVLAQLLSRQIEPFEGRPISLSLNHWRVSTWNYWAFVAAFIGAFLFSDTAGNCFLSPLIVMLFPFLLEGFRIVYTLYKSLFLTHRPWKIIALYGLFITLVWPLFPIIFLGLFEPWIPAFRRLEDPS